jgi:shikimate kinase/3-dehydroquinate synthase
MQRIFLTGLSGAGKTTVGCHAARLLGWRFVDTDELIAERMGQPASQVLSEYGEARFRQLEAEALESAGEQEKVVIATGGGAVIAEGNRRLMRQRGLTIYLRTSVEVAWQRLVEQMSQAGEAARRPLLADGDGQQKLAELYRARQSWYEEARLQITTDAQAPARVARQVVAGAIVHGALLSAEFPAAEIALEPGRTTPQAIVEWGGLHHLPQLLRAAGFQRRVFIVTDTEVGGLYAAPLQWVMEHAGFGIEARLFSVPAGEASKSLACFQAILDWLVEERAEQQEPIIALGGGVIGDLAGFVASCYLRGVPLIQVPTSLLGQVDAAIGGKTGINHPLGKNLIGAFYQPRLTLADPACLLTLPGRAYREGWAEIIKYGMALDAELFELLEQSPVVAPQEAGLLTEIIARCIRLKMKIVGQDERDQGQRAILNYGHTFGHALEARTGYTTWLHGEAVSVGMEVAAQIAIAQGLLSRADANRQQALLCAYGLPIVSPVIPDAPLLEAMQRDKKVRNGTMRWILPTGIGRAGIYNNVPLESVLEAIGVVARRHAEETAYEHSSPL